MSCSCKKPLLIKYKKVNPRAMPPLRATEHAAAFDLTAISGEIIDGDFVYHTGLAFEIPPGYYGKLCARSSIRHKDLVLGNGVGVIDADYRGEVTATFRAVKRQGAEGDIRIYQPGDRVAQLIILELPEIVMEEATELTPTIRGEGGYGSTGR